MGPLILYLRYLQQPCYSLIWPGNEATAISDQVENAKRLLSDEEHSSNGRETEGCEAESPTDSCSSDKGEGDLSATLNLPIHTVT